MHTRETRSTSRTKASAVALVVVDREGRFLLLWHRKYRFWTLPLGKIDSNEAGIDAARREALEELGIATDQMELLDTIYKPRGIDDYSDISIALCRVLSYSGKIRNREPEKHSHLRFLGSHEISMLKPISFPTQMLLKEFSDFGGSAAMDKSQG